MSTRLPLIGVAVLLGLSTSRPSVATGTQTETDATGSVEVAIGVLAAGDLNLVMTDPAFHPLPIAELATADVDAIALSNADLALAQQDPSLRDALRAALDDGKVVLAVQAGSDDLAIALGMPALLYTPDNSTTLIGSLARTRNGVVISGGLQVTAEQLELAANADQLQRNLVEWATQAVATLNEYNPPIPPAPSVEGPSAARFALYVPALGKNSIGSGLGLIVVGQRQFGGCPHGSMLDTIEFMRAPEVAGDYDFWVVRANQRTSPGFTECGPQPDPFGGFTPWTSQLDKLTSGLFFSDRNPLLINYGPSATSGARSVEVSLGFTVGSDGVSIGPGLAYSFEIPDIVIRDRTVYERNWAGWEFDVDPVAAAAREPLLTQPGAYVRYPKGTAPLVGRGIEFTWQRIRPFQPNEGFMQSFTGTYDVALLLQTP